MITQHLILIDPPEAITGLHFTDTQVWACAGCKATIREGFTITHPDGCPELGAYIARAAEAIARPPYRTRRQREQERSVS